MKEVFEQLAFIKPMLNADDPKVQWAGLWSLICTCVSVFLNGVSVWTNTNPYTTTVPTGLRYSAVIGSNDYFTDGSEGYCKNLIDELRISNIARWTENFTPPTQAY